MSSRYASGKNAIAQCDRCGVRVKLKELRRQVIKTKLVPIKVCRSCYDPDHPQLRIGMYPVYDPQAVRDPRPEIGYETAGLSTLGVASEGSRIIQWGWAPVGGGSSDVSRTPNNLVAQTVTANVTVTVG